jgi:hypothetical protein
MSSGVSQIEYWREVNKPDKKANEANTKDVKEGGPGAIYLSYDVFLGLTVIGGILALDHLYLRSPLTFIAKLIVNVLTLGSWWMYDASQAVFNKDVVKVFGLGVPGMGPKGIAAGVLANDVPDKKHMSFLIYGLAVIIGGIFGLDSFIVGDKQSGFIRLICLITGILAPIAIFWWLYNLGMFLFKTKDVTNTYWDYFGAPEPAEHGMTWGEKLATKFPFLQKLFGPISRVKNAVVGTAEGVINTAEALGEAVLTDPIGTAKRVIIAPAVIAKQKVNNAVEMGEQIVDEAVDSVGDVAMEPLALAGQKVEGIVNKFTSELKPAINAAMLPITGAITTAVQPVVAAAAPFKNTLNAGIATAQTGLQVAQEGLALGKNALNTGKSVADKTLNVIGETAEAGTKALTLAPAAMSLASGFTPAAAAVALAKLPQQGGGSNSGVLPYVFIGTLAVIVVSGLVITYRRYRQNEQPRKNDSPPEPGVLRKSNQEKSS